MSRWIDSLTGLEVKITGDFRHTALRMNQSGGLVPETAPEDDAWSAVCESVGAWSPGLRSWRWSEHWTQRMTLRTDSPDRVGSSDCRTVSGLVLMPSR